MPYSTKFVDFFRSNPDLPPDLCTRVQAAVERQPTGGAFSVDALRAKTGMSLSRAAHVMRKLTESGVFRLAEYNCASCGESIDLAQCHWDEEIACPRCGRNLSLWQEPTHTIAEGLDLLDYRQSMWNHGHSLDTDALVGAWERHKAIAYLAVDMVSSERVQREHPVEYSDLLRVLYDDVWPAALATQTGNYLRLGEVGDMVKVAFHNVENAYRAAMCFLDLLRSNFMRVNDQTWLSDEAGKLPRFSAAIGMIHLPVDSERKVGYVDPRRLLTKSMLDQKWDINESQVTRIYRLQSMASPKGILRNEPFRLSLLLTSECMFQLKERTLATEFPEEVCTVEVVKHEGIATAEEIAVVLYYEKHLRALTPDEITSTQLG